MSLLRVFLGRLAVPSTPYVRSLSSSAVLRESDAPAKLDNTESRNLLQEQQDRQTNPVIADVVNDAPCKLRLIPETTTRKKV